MENYAKRLALEHNVQGKTAKRFYPIIFLKEDFDRIRKAYDILTESVSLDVPIPPSGEWLLDNFYVIELLVYDLILADINIIGYSDNFSKIENYRGKKFYKMKELVNLKFDISLIAIESDKTNI